MTPQPPVVNGRLVGWNRDEYDDDSTRERSTRAKSICHPRGPANYFDNHLADKPPSNDPMDDYQPKVTHFTMGNLLHEWLIGGRVGWMVCPASRGTKKWIQFVCANPGFTIVSPSQDKELRAWREAFMRNDYARKRWEDKGLGEQVILWDELVHYTDAEGQVWETYLPCKMATDWLHGTGEMDCLKTTAAQTREAFEADVFRFGYDFSAAFYCRGRAAVPEFAGTDTTFRDIAIVKGQSPQCYVWPLSRQTIGLGDLKVRNALQRIARCRHDSKRIAEAGGDIRAAWPDDIAATQGDPIMPRQWDYDKVGIKEIG